MKLSALLSHFPEYGLPAINLFDAPEVLAAVADSRQVTPGAVFVAVAGGSADGHRFIPDAIARGAVAVVGEQALAGLPVPYIPTPDSRLALAVLSAGLNGFPARKLTVIGVTGTDGKTTTSNLIYHILRQDGIPAGMISTVNAVIGDEELDTGFHVTTPDAPAVQGYLSRMVAAGLTHVVLEATSHGLAQSRVAACDFDIGVVTNITHEHLDYHGSYAAYRQAKGRLFEWLSAGPPKAHNPPHGAVLNRDDSSYEFLTALTHEPVLSYGQESGDVRIGDKDAPSLSGGRLGGIEFEVEGRDLQGEGFRFPVASRLIGQFNVSNLLAAIAATRGVVRLPAESIQFGLAAMPGIPGRMETINLDQDFLAMVDFAHTPNALRRALEAARRIIAGQMYGGRVIAVFGSAGLRDRQKRRMMAETSAELADLTILTAEDPRTESLDAILAEMAAGAESKGGVEGRSFWRIPDRGEAIRFAVKLARPGDVVIACGKGHEQSMCFGEIEYAWDDRIALRAALSERLGLSGPEMPYLPTRDKI
jgi:UDP-N-acetylmuramoyl-L-alanyl-D-glutamate--2,6-diaminopimelate ligase